jgi:hypothetical protein
VVLDGRRFVTLLSLRDLRTTRGVPVADNDARQSSRAGVRENRLNAECAEFAPVVRVRNFVKTQIHLETPDDAEL